MVDCLSDEGRHSPISRSHYGVMAAYVLVSTKCLTPVYLYAAEACVMAQGSMAYHSKNNLIYGSRGERRVEI